MLFRTAKVFEKQMTAVELHIRATRKERSMKSKRFVLNALLVVALLALLAFSCWYANQPAFGYVLYAVMSGDKAYYTLRAIDGLFFYVAGPLSIALLAFLVIYNFKKR